MVFNKQNITLNGLHVHDGARFLVGFPCRCCTAKAQNFLMESFFEAVNKRRQINFFSFSLNWIEFI